VRLKAIAIEGFRAFGRSAAIDLDGDVIVVQGPNGVGKTSLLDAILWALAGRIARFQDRGSPVSLYAREGIARVELTLSSSDGDVVIIRATDGSNISTQLRFGTEEFEGPAAQQQLCNMLLPHLKDRSEAVDALGNVLTRGVYLQQDLVRQFVEGDSAAERFALVSEVIGAGVVLELQQALEKSRNQWSRSTTTFRKDVVLPTSHRITQLDEHLARLTDGATIDGTDAGAALENLYRQAAVLLGQSRIGSSEEPPTTPGRLDRFLKTLTIERTRLEREVATATSLIEQVGQLDDSTSRDEGKASELEQEEIKLAAELQTADDNLRDEIDRLAEERERQVSSADRVERSAALARLALEELGDYCPVCQQAHDVNHTVRHLQLLIEAASQSLPTPRAEDRLGSLNTARTDAQKRLERVIAERRDMNDTRRDREAQQAVVLMRLADFGIEQKDSGDARVQLMSQREVAQITLGTLSRLIAEGERLSLNMLRLGEQQRRDELMAERVALSARLAQASALADRQDHTHAEAGKIIEGLRGASLLVTQRQIEQIAPLFQRIYSRIDPHPTFRVTQIIAGMERGRGQLSVGVLDPDTGSDLRDAGPLLSSSQLNSFAVSLFLAMNLALPSLALSVTVLDDPLQSLDSINLLGLVDVLRRFRAHRQIIVSTHEERLMGLLQRKLRPVRKGERMVTMIFEDWSREGPVFRTTRTDFDTGNQRVLAA
jgi:DNA repair exonuclease SbcCD ATPase subunit